MKFTKAQRAFTLIELLVVIAIMGILAAITVPAFNNMKKADATLAATRQLLDDVGLARQMAISRRTTVYMVFCPSNFWNDPLRPSGPNRYQPLPDTEKTKGARLYDKQLVAYNFVTLRNIGDQPGRGTPRYLGSWRSLPENAYIPLEKFNIPADSFYTIPNRNDPNNNRQFEIYGFAITNNIPFPSEDTSLALRPNATYVTLPYIAFNHLGQLTRDGLNPHKRDEFIPLSRGSVSFNRDDGKMALPQNPLVDERPPGNGTNAYNLIHIDWLTGRARLEHQEISGL